MNIILTLVRLWADDQCGLAPEPVTCKEFVTLQYRYCAQALAETWLDGQLASVQMRLPELDDEPINLEALTLFQAADDLADAGEIMSIGRVNQRNRNSFDTDVQYGYNIAPGGRTETFGGYDPYTVAWINLHPEGPALLYRAGDPDIEQLIDKWLAHWSQSIDHKLEWPDAEEHSELRLPEGVLPSSERKYRKRRYKGRNVRRFLGLHH